MRAETAIVESLESRQLLSLASIAAGAETRVNSVTLGSQSAPSVASDAAGNYVVAWTGENPLGTDTEVYAQRYNAAGVAQGTEFRVNTITTKSQDSPTVAMDEVGDFVIAYRSLADYNIYSQRYNSSGVAQGTEFRVNPIVTNHQSSPRVGIDSAGNFVVTWLSQDVARPKDIGELDAQRFNAAGVTQGANWGLVGALSPSTWWDGRTIIADVMGSAGKMPRPRKVYLDSGDSGTSNDDVTNTAKLAQAYRDVGYVEGIDLHYVLQKGATHSEVYWAQRLPGALRFLLGPRP